MEETKSTESRLAITLQIRKSNYADGVDGVSKWKVEVDRAVARTALSLTRQIMMSILERGVTYSIRWETLESITNDNPDRDEFQLGHILKISHQQSAKEVNDMRAAVITANASLFNLFGTSSLEVLMADPEFRENDAGARDPVVTWSRFMATHITEREGKGSLRSIIATKQLLASVAALQQAQSESLTDFYDRYLRLVKALKEGKLDLCAAWLADDEAETGFFLVSLCPARYSGLIRDVLNGIVEVPANIVELMRIARDRKEAREHLGSTRAKALVTGDLAPDQADRSPLDPYPRVSRQEYNLLSTTDREHQRVHNTTLEEAGTKLFKMGFKNGRYTNVEINYDESKLIG